VCLDKSKLIDAIVTQLKKDLEVLNQAAMATYQGAIHSDSRAEDQYDTRGLEASYLAGAQAKRVAELEDLIKTFQYIDIKQFGPQDKIAATALVGVQSEDKFSLFFLMPKGGGLSIGFEGKHIQILTPQSPIGEVLLGKKLHDEFEVLIQKKFRDYEVISVE
jgi:transcription elongation GreA/GreB family factor